MVTKNMVREAAEAVDGSDALVVGTGWVEAAAAEVPVRLEPGEAEDIATTGWTRAVDAMVFELFRLAEIRGADPKAAPGPAGIEAADQVARMPFADHWAAAERNDWQERGVDEYSRRFLIAWSDAWTGLMALAAEWAGLDPDRDEDIPSLAEMEARLGEIRIRTAGEVIRCVTDWHDAPLGDRAVSVDRLTEQLTAWHARWKDRHGDDCLRQAAMEYSDVADPTYQHDGSIQQNENHGAVFEDLRPSEARRLHELMESARDRGFVRARHVILEEIAAAATAFAREHPEISPRMPLGQGPLPSSPAMLRKAARMTDQPDPRPAP
jgi:hypothetical protein